MALFRRHAAEPARSYDASQLTPAIRCSICTGEQVAGFIHKEDGRFTGVLLLRSPEDLEAFRRQYGIGSEEIRKIY